MREVMLPNKFFMTVKIPLVSYLVLTYAIRFIGQSLMSVPRKPQIILFQTWQITSFLQIIGNKVEIILQVIISMNIHQIISSHLSIRLDLVYYFVILFISLQVQYYFVVLTSIILEVIPQQFLIYSFLAVDNFRVRDPSFLSLDFDCSTFQTVLISVCVYYYFRLRQNKINSFLKLALLSFFCKVLLSYTFLNDYPLLPIFTLGNFMFGFIVSESILPFRTEELKMQNTKIEPYPNVYTQTIERFTKSRFWFLWLIAFIISPFLVSTIAFFQQGCLQALLVNISDIMSTVMASTLLIFRVQCFPSTDEHIGPLLQQFRKIDRSIFLVQQPLYSYLINRFKLVQFGPYNGLILIILFFGVLFKTIEAGYFLSWLFEDLLFVLNFKIITGLFNKKKRSTISSQLISLQSSRNQ